MGRIQRSLLVGLVGSAMAAVGPDVAADSQFDLQGTVWEREAKQCGISPYLLYAIALKESKRATGRQTAAPSPYALNNPILKGRIFDSHSVAKRELKRYLEASQSTDVGVMQVNVRWNGRRVGHPEELLDLQTNVRVGAAILCEAIKLHPGDIELAIGSYHTPNPEMADTARGYGRDVLIIWTRLTQLNKE